MANEKTRDNVDNFGINPEVHIELVRDVPGQRIVRKANRLLFLLRKSQVVGPFEIKMVIPPFKVQRTNIQALVVVNQVPKFLVTASYKTSGEITHQMQNASIEAKPLSYKACLVGVILYLDTQVTWDTSVKKKLESNLVELRE